MNTSDSKHELIHKVVEKTLERISRTLDSKWSTSGIVVKNHLIKIFFKRPTPDLRERIGIEHELFSDLAQLEFLIDLDIELVFLDPLESERPPDIPARVDQPGAFGTQLSRRAIPGVRKIIALASGKGGVGKSTVSAHLALAMAEMGAKIGLLDADLFGPSLPLLFGVEDRRPRIIKANGKDLLCPILVNNIQLMSFGFLSEETAPALWRGPILSKALENFFYDVAWNDLDVLVIDLPPGTGDTQLTLVEKLPLHQILIVSTPQALALADAQRAISMFQKLDIPILGLVENMTGHACSACGHFDSPFGSKTQELADKNKLEILARLPLDLRAQSVGSQIKNTWEQSQWKNLAERILNAPQLGPAKPQN